MSRHIHTHTHTHTCFRRFLITTVCVVPLFVCSFISSFPFLFLCFVLFISIVVFNNFTQKEKKKEFRFGMWNGIAAHSSTTVRHIGNCVHRHQMLTTLNRTVESEFPVDKRIGIPFFCCCCFLFFFQLRRARSNLSARQCVCADTNDQLSSDVTRKFRNKK